jgi:hypothetical protein
MRTKIESGRIVANRAATFMFLVVGTSGHCTAYQSDKSQSLCSIKGIVTDAVTGTGLRKAFVRLRGSTAGKTYPAVTDDAGNFVIEQVEPASYILEAERQGFIESQYGHTSGQVTQLRLTPGEKVTGINVKLMAQAVISGQVVDGDGEVWTHAQVGLNRVLSKRGKTYLQGYSGGAVDDQGQFRIGQLPPGKYYLSAEPDAGWESRNRPIANSTNSRLQSTWYPSARDVDASTPIILEPGQQLSGLEIRLQHGTFYSIRGKVSGMGDIPAFPDRGPFATRSISAQLVSRVAANGYGGVLRSDGSFEIQGVPSGSFEIYVSQGLPPIHLGRATAQVNDQDVEDISIQLIAPRPVNGTIRIEGSKALNPSGLSLSLLPVEGGTWSQTTALHDDGSFTFALVGSERYHVRIQGNSPNLFYIKEIRYGDIKSSDGIISISGAEANLVVDLSTNGARLFAKVKGVTEGNLPLPGGRVSASAAPQVVLVPETLGETCLGIVDQNGGFYFDNLAPGAYKLFAFEQVPDGLWEDPDFLKEIKNKAVDIRLSEEDAQSKEVQLLLKADLAPILRKLGLE